MSKDKESRKRIAEETLGFCQEGIYMTGDGEIHLISADVAAAVAGTREWGPMDPLPVLPVKRHRTRFATVLSPSLEAAKRLADDGKPPLVLNFASARNPGGGFRNGADAQEESLARASALFLCLEGRALYQAAAAGTMDRHLYASHVILSPNVPVIRDDAGTLVAPWACSFLTCPAPNAQAWLAQRSGRQNAQDLRKKIIGGRIMRLLNVAAQEEYEHLVLGAWGCGVFGCDPEMVADAFERALRGHFSGSFQNVVFAIREDRFDHPTVAPFARRFGTG